MNKIAWDFFPIMCDDIHVCWEKLASARSTKNTWPYYRYRETAGKLDLVAEDTGWLGLIYNLRLSTTMMRGQMIVFNHPNWPPSQEIDRLFDRLTEQNRMSSVYSLSIIKIRNNLIWLQNKWKYRFSYPIFYVTQSCHARGCYYHVIILCW